ncbi:MAG TPA: M23 family metallopeptidase [Opitutales bacterium]|nr:M23 family metallopeptidase [Opitutales bacterium]
MPAHPPARLLVFAAIAGLVSAVWAATPKAAAPAKLPFAFAWPAPIPAFHQGGPISAWIQDTGTGDPHSGLFGCVRDDQHKFHEGIDIKCNERDRKGIPLDSVTAVMDGRVAYINSRPGNSNYGDYVVLEHTNADVPVYTLYAHLAAIAPGLKAGQNVTAGAVLGTLGHSGTENIPLDRAHLHFEIGLRMTDQFQSWYDAKKFGSPNEHGAYNGYNLIGSDPIVFFDQIRSGKFKSFADYFRAMPTAFTLRVSTTRVPDFVARYPALLAKPISLAGVAGWDVEFTWYGLPKQLTPLPLGTPNLGKPGAVSIVSYDRNAFALGCTCRDTLLFPAAKNAPPKIGAYLNDVVKLMFGFK